MISKNFNLHRLQLNDDTASFCYDWLAVYLEGCGNYPKSNRLRTLLITVAQWDVADIPIFNRQGPPHSIFAFANTIAAAKKHFAAA
ncbi:MAG: hypothetical protein SF097_25045 [Acidobacteriota bacterium]|nr:hypothetical protein [Acidobacteriota bacterium]